MQRIFKDEHCSAVGSNLRFEFKDEECCISGKPGSNVSEDMNRTKAVEYRFLVELLSSLYFHCLIYLSKKNL